MLDQVLRGPDPGKGTGPDQGPVMENLPPRMLFICQIILHSYLLFFMPRFHIYIIYSYYINLITLEMALAAIENGFATLAMCWASLGNF